MKFILSVNCWLLTPILLQNQTSRVTTASKSNGEYFINISEKAAQTYFIV